MKQYIINGLIAAALIVVAFIVVPPVTKVTNNPPVGASSGSEVSFFTHFANNVNVGGYDFATTSLGAVTYTALSIVNSRVIEHIASGALTATLPTSAALSSAGFLPNIGDTQSIYIHASTTKITLAGNTGTPLFTSASTTVINAGTTARLDFVRLGATEARQIAVTLHND